MNGSNLQLKFLKWLAILAMPDAQASDCLEREEFRDKMDATIARLDTAIQCLTMLNEGVVNLLSSLDEDRPTVLRKLNAIENKVDRLLEQGNADESQM